MKIKINRKYKQIAVLAVIVIVVSGFLLMSAQAIPNLREMFDMLWDSAAPILWGIVIAYLMNPAVEFFRHKIFGKWEKKKKDSPKTLRLIKNLSIFIVVILAIALLTGLVLLIVPQFISSVSGLVTNFDSYSTNFLNWASATFADIPQIIEIIENPISQIESFLTTSWSDISGQIFEFGSKIGGGVLSFVIGFKDFIIGFIIAVYFVSSKEMLKAQSKKLLFAFFRNDHVQTVLAVSKRINDIFSHYIIGIIIDAFFVGCMTFIGATIIGTPYPILMAVIIACTNIIPFFGPFLGGIPVCFITLLADPIKALWIAIFMVAMQQFDGNIMVPLIQGDRIGVPSVWVLIGIIIGGGIFGFVGMLLAVPVFAIIYMLFKEFLEDKLRKKSLPADSAVYQRDDTDKYTVDYVYSEEEQKHDEEWLESIRPKKKHLSDVVHKVSEIKEKEKEKAK
ncbi:MAG: AI-2E family transporter [Ruminiclostridium sp.]|nr:AI-2E family transporter [Ruminiclostridium sp.]